MRPSRRRRRLPVALGALVLAMLAFGIWLGARHPGWLPGPVRAVLVGDASSAVVREAIDDVSRTYYREIPKEQLADNAIEGVVKRLDDRFSNYFTAAEYKRFKESQNSEFSGIGLAVSEHRRGLRVEEVYDGSPADRAGIAPGDIVVAAAGHDLTGRSQDESVSFIKGPPGTEVKVTWLHDGARRTKVITRSTVSVPVVASELERAGACKVGVVRLAQFSSGAHGEVYAALRKAKKAGATGFVLDLRGNGGGLVNEAQLVASAFLPDGVIVTTRGRAVRERTLRASGDPVVPKQPLVVLVDKHTASASEIVTGALQDRHRAEVVGTRTFGKGVFQQILELSNGGALDITAGQYFTPSGRNLGGRGARPGSGISPDVMAMDDPKTKRDEAKARALSVLASSCRG
ncbi:MAG TPA: S41 family peptidase [Solirubrobacteraceae bacterium]|nr:S41 family peptidase [Solirubrobacteraceae bacterium]